MRRFIKLILALGLVLGLALPLSQVSAQDDYIYGVPVENLGNRTYGRPAVDLGYNPDSFQLDADSKTLYTQGISYSVNFEQIPTQTIQLQSAYPEEGTRTIYVNTRVTVTSDPSNGLAIRGHQFYLFYNKFGTISLAFPKLASNTLQKPDPATPYVEYLESGTKKPDYKTVEAVPADQAPYRVDTKNLSPLAYHMNTVNAPSDYSLEFTNYTMSFNYLNDSKQNTYRFQVVDGPTKEIRVYSADGSGIRTVKVNTRLIPQAIVNGNERQFGYTYYLFHNKNGTISLVTPNFAGNYGQGEEDVMTEYVVNP